MSFFDLNMYAGQVGKTVAGLGLSKTGPMTLEVDAGSVTVHVNGSVNALPSAESHTCTADPSLPKQVFMGIIGNGADTDLWVDEYVDDGATMRGDVPLGFELLAEVGWFVIPPGETDLDNTVMYRRIWL